MNFKKTEEIIERLDRLEKKIDILISPEKIDPTPKPLVKDVPRSPNNNQQPSHSSRKAKQHRV
jgi:hypothetical protein